MHPALSGILEVNKAPCRFDPPPADTVWQFLYSYKRVFSPFTYKPVVVCTTGINRSCAQGGLLVYTILKRYKRKDG